MSNSHRPWLALGLLAIVLLVGACGATQSGSVTKGDATRGRNLWAQSACVGCHGVNAQGSMGGPALANTPLTIRDVTNIVRRGGPGMPKYSAGQISERNLQDLYAWFQNPVPAATGELGQDPWTQSACAGCHGVNALGGSGPSLAGTSQPFTAFQTVVRQGAEGMPPFSGTQIGDQTLQAIYTWLQAQAQVPAAQQTLWAQAGCSGCHGAKAEGASAPALTGEEYAYDEFQRVVRQGEEGMPAYSTSQISDTDLQRMYDWLQTLVPAATGELGQDPWTQSACAGCHGVNALGGSGPSLAGTSQPFTAFQTVVRQGAEGMPPFSGTQIGDQTLQAIYTWLQAQAQVPAAQQTLWAQAGCSGCHGAKAEGASAPALTGKEYAYDEFQRVVRQGEEGMPAYSTSQISETDLQRMYDWLMALP